MTAGGQRFLPLLLLLLLLCACGEKDCERSSAPPEPSPAPTAFDFLDYENPVKLARADNYLEGFSYSVYVDHVSITGYYGTAAKVEVPAKIDGVPVTVVSGSFSDSVEQVTLPEGLLHLSLSSFWGCAGLERLTLPATLQSLSPADVSTERHIELRLAEDSLYFTMEDGVLFDRDMETLIWFPRDKTGSYTLPASVKTVGEHAFSCCNAEEIILPEGLLEIREGAFDRCARLSSVTLPKSLRTLGDAFSTCTELEAVEVSPENPDFQSVDGVLYSGDMETLLVYPPARPAAEFTVPETVRWGWQLPLFCEGLQTLTIPAGVEPVGYYFPEETHKTVYFPGGAEEWRSLFRQAFLPPRVRLAGQTGADMQYEGDYAYTLEHGQATVRGYVGTDTELEIPQTLGGCPVTAIGEEALCFLAGADWTETETGQREGRARAYRVTVPEGVAALGDRAFYGSNLVSVLLPSTLTELGAQVFAFCDTLGEITVSPGNSNFTAADGALYTADMTTLVHLSGHEVDAEAGTDNQRQAFVLPASVTDILPGAFLGCPDLDAIGVEAGSGSFADADGVLTDRSGKTLIAYPSGALQRQVPETVETIGAYAFARCKLPDRTAYLLRNVTELGEGAFAYSTVPVVTIPETITSLPKRAFFGGTFSGFGSPRSELHLPAGLSSVGEDAFCFCTAPETVYFGGTESDWREISMASGNEALEHAHMEFESP